MKHAAFLALALILMPLTTVRTAGAPLPPASSIPLPPTWSAAVAGVEGRLSFRPGHSTSGLVLVYTELQLRNVSDVASPIYLTYDPAGSLQVTLQDAAGHTVDGAANPADVLTPVPYLVSLPYHGTLSFDVTAFGYTTPHGVKALLGLGCGSWNLLDGRAYSARGTFKAGPAEPGETRRLWNGTLQFPDTPVALVETH